MLELPRVERGEYLIEYLFDLGPSVGSDPVGYIDIMAFCQAKGLELNAWESETIRMLSREYISERHAATDPVRPSPIQSSGDKQAQRAAVVAGFKAMSAARKADD